MTNPLFHKHTYAAGEIGVITFPVSAGRSVQIGVKDKGTGGVFDVINYLVSAADDATREQWKSEENMTGEYSETSIGGFVEVGINLKVASDGDVVLEVLEFVR